MTLCCESILGVTVETVLGNQVYLEWIGTLGSFVMVARPLAFLLTFEVRPPPLEVRLECQDSFPDEARYGPSSRDEDRQPGLFLTCGGTLGVLLEW